QRKHSPPDIEALVAGFRANAAALREHAALEASLRQEFLDPFWEALGWDVRNASHLPPSEQEVLVEARVEKSGAGTGRLDYLFRIDSFPKLAVEAKRVGVDVGTDKDAIFQAKMYGWSSHLPFAVLTNFGRFRLFDTTLRPHHDAPGHGL